LSIAITESTTSTPATAPIRIAAGTLTVSAPAVMPTSPARQPLSTIVRSGFFCTDHEVTIAVTTPAAAASDVVTRT
jgi:hypothetical protein